MTNPLVAARQDSTTWDDGLPLFDAGADCARAIANGDWIEAGMSGAVAGLDVLSAVLDPLGTALSGVAGWLLDHCGPLSAMLDSLAGDGDAVMAASHTWANIARSLRDTADEFQGVVQRDVATWGGAAAASYGSYAWGQANVMRGLAVMADGAGAGVALAGTVVASVRALVRDILATFAGRLAAWAIEAAATFGVAIPAILAQATAAISRQAAVIARFLRSLVRSMGALGDLLRSLKGSMDDVADLVKRTAHAQRHQPVLQGPLRPTTGPARPSAQEYLDHLKAWGGQKAPLTLGQEVSGVDEDSPYFRSD